MGRNYDPKESVSVTTGPLGFTWEDLCRGGMGPRFVVPGRLPWTLRRTPTGSWRWKWGVVSSNKTPRPIKFPSAEPAPTPSRLRRRGRHWCPSVGGSGKQDSVTHGRRDFRLPLTQCPPRSPGSSSPPYVPPPGCPKSSLLSFRSAGAVQVQLLPHLRPDVSPDSS